MPVELVDVVQSQHIYKLTNRIGSYKVASHVEMSATVCKSRSIGNVYSRNLHLSSLAANDRQRLAQRLYTIEHTSRSGAADAHMLTVHLKGISLGIFNALVDVERNSQTALNSLAHNGTYACRLLDILCQHIGIVFKLPFAKLMFVFWSSTNGATDCAISTFCGCGIMLKLAVCPDAIPGRSIAIDATTPDKILMFIVVSL